MHFKFILHVHFTYLFFQSVHYPYAIIIHFMMYLYVSDSQIFIFNLDFSFMSPTFCMCSLNLSTWGSHKCIGIKSKLSPDTSKSAFLLNLYPQIHFRVIFSSSFFPEPPLRLETVKSISETSFKYVCCSLLCLCFPPRPLYLFSWTDPVAVLLIFPHYVTSFSKSFLMLSF